MANTLCVGLCRVGGYVAADRVASRRSMCVLTNRRPLRALHDCPAGSRHLGQWRPTARSSYSTCSGGGFRDHHLCPPREYRHGVGPYQSSTFRPQKRHSQFIPIIPSSVLPDERLTRASDKALSDLMSTICRGISPPHRVTHRISANSRSIGADCSRPSDEYRFLTKNPSEATHMCARVCAGARAGA